MLKSDVIWIIAHAGGNEFPLSSVCDKITRRDFFFPDVL
jgi:hypothetical protein